MSSVAKRTIDDLKSLTGKRVLVRADFNVPRDKKTGEITDDKRIRAVIPTIKKLVGQSARVILMTHLGRPKGWDNDLSTRIVSDRLSELLDQPVIQAFDVIGDDAKKKAEEMKEGEILMLENVRFHKEETANDPAFARELASLGDIFVNDAFGTAHRAHASTEGIAHFLFPVAGYLMQKEIDIMAETMARPKKPFVAVLGGAKVSDKIGVIYNLLKKADTVIIGGAMAYTFFAAKGWPVGQSLCEVDKIEDAKMIMEAAEEAGVKLLLPVDNVVTDRFDAQAEHQIVESKSIPEHWMGMDIGPRTAEIFADALKDAKTIVWNGPMGVFEFERFALGTKAVAEAIAANKDAVSIIGGGDSALAVEQAGFADQVTHISTGGGASLELLEGKVLPGLAALAPKQDRRVLPSGNWKMNREVPKDAVAFFDEFKEKIEVSSERIILCVPYTALEASLAATAGTNIFIGAENGCAHDSGAYTGEISMRALAEMTVPYVIIGHSERRQYYNETDESVNEKVKAALHWGRFPIICVGETLEERESGKTFDKVEKQVKEAVKDIDRHDFWRLAIAYEPIWAIGTGKTATSEQAEEVCAHIRRLVKSMHNDKTGNELEILYGGSVKPANAKELFAMENIDGGLVGGASLKPDDFSAIVEAAAEVEETY